MGYADFTLVADVKDPKTFFQFCQQQTGIAYPSGVQLGMAKKSVNVFFEKYPTGSYNSLCKLVHWCKVRRVRYETVANLVNNGVQYAIRDGFLDELVKVET